MKKCSSPSVGLLSTKQQRWIPPSIQLRDVKLNKNELVFRRVRSILNKLTPEKFHKLCQEILNIGIDSKVVLKGIVLLIYDKAVDELSYSSLYANLCRRLYHEGPNFDHPVESGPSNTFRNLLISKLQDEFENRHNKSKTSSQENEQHFKTKKHVLGNIKFIGELYRLNILQENILHNCIRELINSKNKDVDEAFAQDLECLCQIMTTCGKRLDHKKAKSLMDQYFNRIEYLQKKKTELSARVRFMLQDVVELRKNKWVPRSVKQSQNQGPKTLDQVRCDMSELYPTLLDDIPSTFNHEDYKSNITLANSDSSSVDHLANETPSLQPSFDFFSSSDQKKNYDNTKKTNSLLQQEDTHFCQHSFELTAHPATINTFQPSFQQSLQHSKKVKSQKPGAINTHKDHSNINEEDSCFKEVIEQFQASNIDEQQVFTKLMESDFSKKNVLSFCFMILEVSLQDGDNAHDKICRVIKLLINKQVVQGNQVEQVLLIRRRCFSQVPNIMMRGLKMLLRKLSKQEENIPRIKSAAASLLARLVIHSLIELTIVVEFLKGGSHFPLFLLMLQQLNKIKDKSWLVDVFKKSQIDMRLMMPETSRSDESMLEILSSKQLLFLLPFLRIESELRGQLLKGLSVNALYRWLRAHVDPSLYTNPDFIRILVTCCLDHVTRQSSLAEGVDWNQPTSKKIQAEEKKRLLELSPLLQKFLHNSTPLQLRALYAVQVFCFDSGFPKGLMLRLFRFLYEEDVVDEESFFLWREDFNELYPGKERSLFQVNSWLAWLQEANTEDEDDLP